MIRSDFFQGVILSKVDRANARSTQSKVLHFRNLPDHLHEHQPGAPVLDFENGEGNLCSSSPKSENARDLAISGASRVPHSSSDQTPSSTTRRWIFDRSGSFSSSR